MQANIERELVQILPEQVVDEESTSEAVTSTADGDYSERKYGVNYETEFGHLKLYAEQLRLREPERILREERIYWPNRSLARQRPDRRGLSDKVLLNLLDSIYTALDHDLRVMAAIGMRIVFDRASELVGVDVNKTFAQKLEQLHSDGHVSKAERERLEVLTDAGSAAAHRGWQPDLEQLETLVSIMEHFVNHFTLNEDVGKLRHSIPSRHYRRNTKGGGELSQVIEFPASKNSNS